MFDLKISFKVFLFLFAAALLTTSCSEDSENDVGYAADTQQNAFQLLSQNASTDPDSSSVDHEDYEGGLEEIGDCFEVVYPIDVSFPDGSTQSVASDEELETAIETWFQDNPDAQEFPSPVFPIDVVVGTETISVDSEEALRELISQCPDDEGEDADGMHDAEGDDMDDEEGADDTEGEEADGEEDDDEEAGDEEADDEEADGEEDDDEEAGDEEADGEEDDGEEDDGEDTGDDSDDTDDENDDDGDTDGDGGDAEEDGSDGNG